MQYGLTSYILFATNFLLGWLDGRNLLLAPTYEVSDAIHWGILVGQALFAITWVSLGPAPFYRRAIMTLNWGLVLSILTWLGFLLARGSKAWEYKTEFGYVVTQLPAAVLIASAPLFLFRIRSFLVITRVQRSELQRISDIALLLIAFLLVALPLAARRFSTLPVSEDLYWAFVFGAIATPFTFLIVPFIVIAFFRERLSCFWFLLLLAAFVTLGQLVAASFPFPSGGGSYTAFREAGILALVSIAVVSLLCIEKRLHGYRLHRHRPISMAQPKQ